MSKERVLMSGRFVLTSNGKSQIQGNTIAIAYSKKYVTGSMKNQVFKYKETWAWPLISIISVGYGKATNAKGHKFNVAQSCAVEDNSGLVLNPTTRMLKLSINGLTYIFEEADFVRFPEISAAGVHSKLGAYTVTGECSAAGVSQQTFKFKWGKCVFNFSPTIGLGREMSGTVSHVCTGKKALSEKGNSEFFVSVGAQASLTQFSTQPSELYLSFSRDSSSFNLYVGDFVLFPVDFGFGH